MPLRPCDAITMRSHCCFLAAAKTASDTTSDFTVMALVVTTPGSTLTEQDVIDYARTKLAHYKCPKVVEFRESLARTATGKLQKFKLREPYWADMDRKVH